MTVLSACGLATDDLGQETGDLTGPGPHATGAAVRIVYPETSPALGVSYVDLAARWDAAAAEVDGAVPLRLANGTAVAESDGSGVALDVIITDGEVDVAQLSVTDGAGDEDDAANRAAVEAFIGAVGLDPATAMAGLGVPPGPVHVDDQDVEAVFEGDGTVILYAANEDTVLVGAIGGPWTP